MRTPDPQQLRVASLKFLGPSAQRVSSAGLCAVELGEISVEAALTDETGAPHQGPVEVLVSNSVLKGQSGSTATMTAREGKLTLRFSLVVGKYPSIIFDFCIPDALGNGDHLASRTVPLVWPDRVSVEAPRLRLRADGRDATSATVGVYDRSGRRIPRVPVQIRRSPPDNGPQVVTNATTDGQGPLRISLPPSTVDGTVILQVWAGPFTTYPIISSEQIKLRYEPPSKGRKKRPSG
ncbi:MAG TPA: hypothetical protein VGN26_24665 [Armatimonadota bacterium]